MPLSPAGVLRRIFHLCLGLGLALSVGLTACGPSVPSLNASAQPTHQVLPRSKLPSPAPMRWLLAASAWRLVQADATATQWLNQPYNVLIVHRAIPAHWQGQAIESFPSYRAFHQAVVHHTLVRGIVGVGYDNEAWPLTPAAERAHPAHYEAAFAALAHAHHLQYWQLGNLAAAPGGRVHGAAFATAIDLQVQSSERTPLRYAALVRSLSQQARALRASVAVFAGLSTNPPPGTPVSATTLVQDVRATQDVVAGYWLNIPSSHSRACPRCGPQSPGVARALLNQLAQTSAAPAMPSTAATIRHTARTLWLLATAHFGQGVQTPAVRALFAAGTVFEPLSPRQSPSDRVPVVPTVVVHSARLFQQALAHPTLRPGTALVLYDNEWSLMAAPRTKPPWVLTPEDRAGLDRLAPSRTAPRQAVEHAQILVAYAEGSPFIAPPGFRPAGSSGASTKRWRRTLRPR